MSLWDSRYKTDVEELIKFLESYGQAATLLIFEDTSSLAPCFSFEVADMLIATNASDEQQDQLRAKRKRLYNYFSARDDMRFVFKLNIRGVEVALDPEMIYKNVEEAIVDTFNISQIMELYRRGKLPNLQKLTLHRPGLINFADLATRLTSLSLHNNDTNPESIPSKPELKQFKSLKELKLSRFNVGVLDNLPAVAYFERCQIDRISGRKNKELTLIECFFQGIEDEPEGWFSLNSAGFPGRILRLERNSMLRPIDLDGLERDLEEISLVETMINDSDYADADFSEYTKLKTLTLDGCDGTVMFSRFSEVTTFAVSWDGSLLISPPQQTRKELPPKLTTLSISGGSVRAKEVFEATQKVMMNAEARVLHAHFLEYPQTITRLDFTNMIISLTGFFERLPRHLETLYFYSCVLRGTDNASTLPQTLKDLRFFNCYARSFFVDVAKLPESLDKLTVVGDKPLIERIPFPAGMSIEEQYEFGNNQKLEIVATRSEPIALDFDAFNLYCIDMSMKEIFLDYEDILNQVVSRRSEFYVRFLSMRFTIPLPSIDVFSILIDFPQFDDDNLTVNQNTDIVSDNIRYSIADIRKMMKRLRNRKPDEQIQLEKGDINDRHIITYLTTLLDGLSAGDAQPAKREFEEL